MLYCLRLDLLWQHWCCCRSGLSLPIYVGPVIIIPTWMIILKRIVRISRVNKISSIADFFAMICSVAFGSVTNLFFCLLIFLQLKSISDTFYIVTNTQSSEMFSDTTTMFALLCLFASYYGTKYVDASKKTGIVTAVAIESILKLVFF
jgi:Na+/proline symporter